MKTHTESAVDPKRLSLLGTAGNDAIKVLGLASANEPPANIVDAVDNYIFEWQQGRLPAERKLDAGDAPFSLGPLWGQQLIRQFGWHWSTITFHQHGNSTAPGVISPDGALAVYPIHFVMGCLKNPGVDVTIMLAYNMLAGGKIGKLNPNEYVNLMERVRRIVPRA